MARFVFKLYETTIIESVKSGPSCFPPAFPKSRMLTLLSVDFKGLDVTLEIANWKTLELELKKDQIMKNITTIDAKKITTLILL